MFVRGAVLIIHSSLTRFEITGIQFGGVSLPANLWAILFLLLPGMVHLRRHWNGCRCHGVGQHYRIFECECLSDRREYGIDVNADFPFTTFSGHTSGSAFANSSGRLSLSSAQFALS